MRKYLIALICAVCLHSPLAAAQDSRPQTPFTLQMPVDCTLGQSCWLVNYPDSDESLESARDYACGPLSYDGHDGTDFAIRDLVALEMGVNVRAAAAGKVLRLRDELEDKMPTTEDLAALNQDKKSCGNGVVIQHQGGYQTLYCHLKQGSVRVAPGDTLKAGSIIAQVGHSGAAEFPHLHFMVMKDGKTIDPFTGTAAAMGCVDRANNAPAPLWASALAYEPASIYASGFRTAIPDLEALRIDANAPATLNQGESAVLTFWALLFGVAQGDLITLEMRGPDGAIIARKDIMQDKTRARQFYYIGKDYHDQNPQSQPDKGRYSGTITLSRPQADGTSITRTKDTTILIE